MTFNYIYNQETKCFARHNTLVYAVEMLTTNRNRACCVERSYVRKIYDYFKSMDESQEYREVQKIDINYIKDWEFLFDTCVGSKRPQELTVCYLSGPEPQNDFDELISLGILPQNIWAFESDNRTYLKALSAYDNSIFPQPKIVKTSVEQFFKQTPKKFDIIYIDACGSLVSDQHSLRCVSSLFKFHRLNSPGIVITNFASPDISNPSDLNIYVNLITQYIFFKTYPNASIELDKDVIVTDLFLELKAKVKTNFSEYYSEFITASIRDIGSILVPVLRFANSNYISGIANNYGNIVSKKFSIEQLNMIKNNSLYKFTGLIKLIEDQTIQPNQSVEKSRKFLSELSGVDDLYLKLFDSFRILSEIKNNNEYLNNDIIEIKSFFDNGQDMYRFLDKPNSNLFFDLIINQLAYPMHYNAEAIKRYTYNAKKTDMYMDIIIFDECRYIYDWLPTLHQIKNAFSNPSWQCVFRFALDGLIKQRINYNNEYFFQGSVIDKNVNGFRNKIIDERIKI